MCWTCQKVGHRSSECPLNKSVGNVEEGDKQETENVDAAVTLDAGGVCWINAVEKECRQCEGFQSPKKTARAGTSWRRRSALEEAPVPVTNRCSSLAVSGEDYETLKVGAGRHLVEEEIGTRGETCSSK